MRKEIATAVESFHQIAFGTKRPTTQLISNDQLSKFVTVLTKLLVARYKNNWYPRNPSRGSGYRCLRVNTQAMDPTIIESLLKSDIPLNSTLRALELTLWVDPGEVSVRIGEEGSVGVLALKVDVPKDSTSEDEAYVSRSPSPVAQTVFDVTPRKISQSSPLQRSPETVNTSNTYNKHVSPRSIPVTHAISPSQDYLPSGNIPAQPQSRARALFAPRPQNNTNNGNYQYDMVMAHHAHMAAMAAGHMPQYHNLDIPAQA